MKTALLVIDDEPQRAEELCFLLRFLEESHVGRAESSNWQAQVEQNADLRCVFLGRYGSAGQIPSDAIHAIRTLAPRAALILVEEADQPVRLPATLEASCGGHLSRPFRHSQLSAILSRLQDVYKRQISDVSSAWVAIASNIAAPTGESRSIRRLTRSNAKSHIRCYNSW